MLYEQEDGLAIVRLNRPTAMNALNEELTDEIGSIVQMLEKDPQVRVLIITGNDKVFAAGGDISEMMHLNTVEIYRFMFKGHRAFDQLEELKVPTIAAINGPCLGGGCELAMCCDFRIAGEKAIFGQPEISLGTLPGNGGTQRLTRLVGVSKAKEMIYLGSNVNANVALEIGLVNKVVADNQVMEEAKRLAKQLMQKPAIGLWFAKETINCGIKTDFNTGNNTELARFAMSFSSHDTKEGMSAFAEKRKPNFTNS